MGSGTGTHVGATQQENRKIVSDQVARPTAANESEHSLHQSAFYTLWPRCHTSYLPCPCSPPPPPPPPQPQPRRPFHFPFPLSPASSCAFSSLQSFPQTLCKLGTQTHVSPGSSTL